MFADSDTSPRITNQWHNRFFYFRRQCSRDLQFSQRNNVFTFVTDPAKYRLIVFLSDITNKYLYIRCFIFILFFKRNAWGTLKIKNRYPQKKTNNMSIEKKMIAWIKYRKLKNYLKTFNNCCHNVNVHQLRNR